MVEMKFACSLEHEREEAPKEKGERGHSSLRKKEKDWIATSSKNDLS